MKLRQTLLAVGLLAASATLAPDPADARPRGGGAHAGGFHGGGGHRPMARPGRPGGGGHWAGHARPGWHGGHAYYRGGYGRGWGYPAAGVAAGAALGAAAAYGSSCYQTQSVWNGYAYVQQTVRVC